MPDWIGRLLAILPLALVCYGQVTVDVGGGPVTQVQGPKHTVTGTVVNAVSGEPIRHALVQMFGMRSARALTGADGRFEFAEVPEGMVNINAQKPGYFDSRALSNFGQQAEAGFTVGSDKNDFQVKLYPAAKIAGRVIDGDGEPVSAQVQVLAGCGKTIV